MSEKGVRYFNKPKTLGMEISMKSNRMPSAEKKSQDSEALSTMGPSVPQFRCNFCNCTRQGGHFPTKSNPNKALPYYRTNAPT